MPQPATKEDDCMKRTHLHNFIQDSRGETLVEVMVAFIVLMIVIATFTASINSASAAVNNSKDIRQRSDSDYVTLHESLNTENLTHSIGTKSSDPSSPTTITITGTDGNITLSAYKYRAGETDYWVFR